MQLESHGRATGYCKMHMLADMLLLTALFFFSHECARGNLPHSVPNEDSYAAHCSNKKLRQKEKFDTFAKTLTAM